MKGALGNLPLDLACSSASFFLSLTSLTFNRWSQFAGRETPRWQEMKPPQLLDTHLPHSTVLLLLSIHSSILLSSVSQDIKGLEEKHGDSLGRPLLFHPSFCTAPSLPLLSIPGFCLLPTVILRGGWEDKKINHHSSSKTSL